MDDNRLPKQILYYNLKGEEIFEDHKRGDDFREKGTVKEPKPYR